jgi:hypothetical protein
MARVLLLVVARVVVLVVTQVRKEQVRRVKEMMVVPHQAPAMAVAVVLAKRVEMARVHQQMEHLHVKVELEFLVTLQVPPLITAEVVVLQEMLEMLLVRLD